MVKRVGLRVFTIIMVMFGYFAAQDVWADIVRALHDGGLLSQAVKAVVLTVMMGISVAITLGYSVMRLAAAVASLALGCRLRLAWASDVGDEGTEAVVDAVAAALLSFAGVAQLDMSSESEGRLMGGLCLGLALLYLASAVTHFALKRWPPAEEEWKDVAGESMAIGAGIFATIAVMALGAAAGVAEVGPAWRYERSVRPLVLGETTSLCAGLACSGRRAFSFRVPTSGEVSLVAVAFDGCSTDLHGVDGEPLRSEEGEPLSLEKLSFTTPHHGLTLVDQPGRELAFALDACAWDLTVSEVEP